MSKRWTEGELNYLEKNYKKMSAIEISEQLNRSHYSVLHKAKRIGLAEKRNYWDEDDEIYLEYFAFEGDSKLSVASEFLDRSTNAVGLRLTKLRANRTDYYIRKPWTEKEDEFIKNNYKSISYALIAMRFNRTHKAVMERARDLGLKKYMSLVALDGQIRQLADEGLCPADIARKLNIKANSMLDYLKKHQIEHNVLTNEQSLERARAKSPWKQMEQARYAEYLSKLRGRKKNV